MWIFSNELLKILQYFTGEKSPKIKNPKDKRRMFLTEFTKEEQEQLINFFIKNQALVVNDILKGRGQFASEWFLVILKIEKQDLKWLLKAINEVINFYSGEMLITDRGSISKITMQRKGRDNGRISANMLQFKINPCELFSNAN